MPPPYPQLTLPLTPAQIEAALADLAASFPSMCTLRPFPHRSVEGRDIHFVTLARGDGADRPQVVVLGGVHARESAPPDALVRLAQNLLTSAATGTDVVFPPRSCTPLGEPAVRYPQFAIPASVIATVLDAVDLHIAPLINPDGRLFDQLNPPANGTTGGWRKNRRPHLDPSRVGVDINRNHDVAWRFEDYYDMSVYLSSYRDGPASLSPRDLTYRGPAAASEPETRNVQWIADTIRAGWFVDVHQFGRKVLTSWGIEDNGNDPAMSYAEPSWDGRRDGLRPGDPMLPPGRPDYREFVGAGIAEALTLAAGRMREAILRSAGVDPAGTRASRRRAHSTYDVGQSASLYHPFGGPVTGTTDDYAFRRQFDDAGHPRVLAFTLETGHEDEQGFHPSYSSPPGHYAKIEREIHAAIVELCVLAAGQGP